MLLVHACSGESGAGKSETTKLLIQHVVELCKAGKTALEQNIGRLNPLLEAFGNAKTRASSAVTAANVAARTLPMRGIAMHSVHSLHPPVLAGKCFALPCLLCFSLVRAVVQRPPCCLNWYWRERTRLLTLAVCLQS